MPIPIPAMSHDLSNLENELKKLCPAGLDDALLTRMESCADGSWTHLDPTEIAMEKELRAIVPSPLPANLAAQLESILSSAPFPTEEKIVVFPSLSATRPRTNRNWAIAAAVALMGACAAWFVPNPTPAKNFAANPPATEHSRQPSPALPDTGKLIPAGFNRGLSEASDHGVIWQPDNRPHRVLKVVYRDRVTLKDNEGRTYQIEQPRVEYIIVPAKTD